MSWPGYDEPAPAVVMPTRPRGNRIRHGSEAYIPRLSPNTIMIDHQGNMLNPPILDPYGRVQRASSVSGARPSSSVTIINDNGASNKQYLDERPLSSHGHRRNRSRNSGIIYEQPIQRVRSGSRVRRRTPSPYDDEYADEYLDEYEDRRRVVHVRHRSHSSEHREEKHKRTVEDEAAIRELEEMKKQAAEIAQKKKLEEELVLERLKEEKEKKERETEDKKLKDKAIEEYKLKVAEEEKKRAKEEEEQEEKLVSLLMAGNPGMTERDARKFVRRAEKNKERAGRGGSPERGAPLEQRAMDRVRPTYIKVHQRHLSPETLDVYNLPWEWDERDTGYIIIKQWVSEHEQEILFNHTRQIKERARLTYPRDQLKADGNQIVIIKEDKKKQRKKSPNPIKTSWFLT